MCTFTLNYQNAAQLSPSFKGTRKILKVRRICTQIYCLKYYVFNNCVNRVSTPPKNPTDQCPLADKLPIDKNIAFTAYMQ